MTKRKKPSTSPAKAAIHDSIKKNVVGKPHGWRQVKMAGTYAIAFVCVFLACDRLLALTLSQWVKHRPLTNEHKAIEDALQAHSQGYIFGSSRANHHYDPDILAQVTGISFYNAGADGQDIMYLRMLADLIEERTTPRVYVVNLSFSDLMKSNYRYKHVNVLRPYYRQSSVVRRLLQRVDKHWSRYHTWVNSYDYNAKLWGLFYRPQLLPSRKGYVPLRRQFDPAENQKNFRLASQMDELVVRELISFIRQAQSKNIKVILSVGPTYRYRTNFTLDPADWFLLCGIRQIAQQLRTPYIEIPEVGDAVYRDPHYYADIDHLNEQGAAYYSLQVAKNIKNILALKDPQSLEQSPYVPLIQRKDYQIPQAVFNQPESIEDGWL